MGELLSNDFDYLERVFENFVARNDLGSILFGISLHTQGKENDEFW